MILLRISGPFNKKGLDKKKMIWHNSCSNAFTQRAWTSWALIPTHVTTVNVLFLAKVLKDEGFSLSRSTSKNKTNSESLSHSQC